MKSPEVKCNVTECMYNEQASICNATSIQVNKHHSKATSTEATDCGTFKLRQFPLAENLGGPEALK